MKLLNMLIATKKNSIFKFWITYTLIHKQLQYVDQSALYWRV
jgi:hypothetical protein